MLLLPSWFYLSGTSSPRKSQTQSRGGGSKAVAAAVYAAFM